MAQWQTSDLLGLMEDEDDDADLREAMAHSMRTYQAEHPGQGQGQGQLLPSSSPDADTDDDDDLQQALALSMRTYEAEQQNEPGRQLNKRSNSPAAADAAGADGRAALAGAAVEGEEAAPAKKPRSSNSPWQQPAAAADGAARPYQANLSNWGIGQQGAAAADTNAGVARQPYSAAALLLASSGLLALGQAPPALQLLALQQHNMQQQQQQQQHSVQQRQHLQPAAGGMLARCMPSPACGNPQQPAAAGAQPGLGRSGSVQDLGQLAANAATLAGNTTAAAADDDLDLYDLGDWVDEGDDDVASRGSGGSGVAGMYAHYSAMQLNEQPCRQQQPQQQQQQQPPLQQPHQGLPRSGLGSSSSEVGARRLYQLREPVWYIDPLFPSCFRGCVFGADAAEQGGSSSALGVSGSISSRYIVDLQCAAVRYVEATAAQLLPRLCVGDWVWCKPSMAHHNQLGAASKLRMQQQQQQQQANHDPWIGAEWVLGQVVSAQLHLSVPVCEVRLADGDTCWFPNIHLEQVREVGESSNAAETRGVAQQAAAAAVTDVPAAEAADAGVAAGTADLQQQQQGQLPEPQQQHADQTAGMHQQQQQQRCAAELPLVPSNGSGHGLHGAGSTGSVRCTAHGSCGAAAPPDMATAGAGADAGAAGLEIDATPDASAAAAAGPGAADNVPVQLADSLCTAAAGVACGEVAVDEEVADSTDLLLLLPAAEGAGDSREEAAQGELGKAGPVQQQLPAAAVAVGEAATLL